MSRKLLLLSLPLARKVASMVSFTDSCAQCARCIRITFFVLCGVIEWLACLMDLADSEEEEKEVGDSSSSGGDDEEDGSHSSQIDGADMDE